MQLQLKISKHQKNRLIKPTLKHTYRKALLQGLRKSTRFFKKPLKVALRIKRRKYRNYGLSRFKKSNHLRVGYFYKTTRPLQLTLTKCNLQIAYHFFYNELIVKSSYLTLTQSSWPFWLSQASTINLKHPSILLLTTLKDKSLIFSKTTSHLSLPTTTSLGYTRVEDNCLGLTPIESLIFLYYYKANAVVGKFSKKIFARRNTMHLYTNFKSKLVTKSYRRKRKTRFRSIYLMMSSMSIQKYRVPTFSQYFYKTSNIFRRFRTTRCLQEYDIFLMRTIYPYYLFVTPALRTQLHVNSRSSVNSFSCLQNFNLNFYLCYHTVLITFLKLKPVKKLWLRTANLIKNSFSGLPTINYFFNNKLFRLKRQLKFKARKKIRNSRWKMRKFFRRLRWRRRRTRIKRAVLLKSLRPILNRKGLTKSYSHPHHIGVHQALTKPLQHSTYDIWTHRGGLILFMTQLSLLNTLLFLMNPFLLKLYIYPEVLKKSSILTLQHIIRKSSTDFINYSDTNIYPSTVFSKILCRRITSRAVNNHFRADVTPWYYHTLIRFLENLGGMRAFIQFYPFMAQEITISYEVRYRLWLPRMAYYERKLGHRFFLEEAIHILHLGFLLRDASIIASWLKSMILRISFWRTRSIFRFIKYIMAHYFILMFPTLGVKGLKIKLKGKISVAGNSRKRTILYRTGLTSHSTVDLRVLHEVHTINTFTGVMGFQFWLYY